MAEKIGKIQENPDNYKVSFLYYNRARDAMYIYRRNILSE